MKPLFKGSAVALVTPFQNGQVDEEALRRLVEVQVQGGSAAIVSVGTTGEPSTMSLEERERVVRITVESVRGRIPVICGTGSNSTASVIENEKRFRDLGCAAQLVVTPYYNKTSQEGLYAHYMTVAEKTELPVIVYNVPSRTNLELSPDVLYRLSQSGRFIGLKESSYQLPLIMEKIDAMGDRMSLFCGNDDMVYPMLCLGAWGCISVVSNVAPKIMALLCRQYFEGDSEASFAIQRRILPLVKALFREVSPIPCKYAMEKLGLCSGELRLPLVPASELTRQEMDKAIETMNYR